VVTTAEVVAAAAVVAFEAAVVVEVVVDWAGAEVLVLSPQAASHRLKPRQKTTNNPLAWPFNCLIKNSPPLRILPLIII
jgi:hypothetical protein